MRDLFGDAPKTNDHAYLEQDRFRWVVGVFRSDGAIEIIKRANEHELKTYYPIRRTYQGQYAPLWANYLFIEFKEGVTIELCRTTSSFINIISAHDDKGLLRPVLVRKNAIDESLRLMRQGTFDDRMINRQFYGKGHIVRVIDGNFIDQRVKLEVDVTPEMTGRTRIKVDINGLKAVIELHKLAL